MAACISGLRLWLADSILHAGSIQQASLSGGVNLVRFQLLLVDALKESLDVIVSKYAGVELIDDALDGRCTPELLEHGWCLMLWLVVGSYTGFCS